MSELRASASAPASVGNVGVGFDILGMCFDVARDRVTVSRQAAPGVALGDVSGLLNDLPTDPMANTALRAAQSVLEASGAAFGVRVDVVKGVPMSAGMGGSAASAVAAAMATNALLDAPMTREELFAHALEGERASSEDPPLDNVAAALMGGLTLALSAPLRTVPLPVPSGLRCVLVRPHCFSGTREGRAILPTHVDLKTAIRHAGDVAEFVTGCFRDDHGAIARSLIDRIAEPARAPGFPYLAAAQTRARNAGAFGCTLSGSGPSVFAWAPENKADAVAEALAEAVSESGLEHSLFVGPLGGPGAMIHP